MQPKSERAKHQVQPEYGPAEEIKSLSSVPIEKTPYKVKAESHIDVALRYVKMANVMAPVVFGFIDEITDFIYFFSQSFAHESIRELFAFFLVFVPFLQTAIWSLFFAASDAERNREADLDRRQGQIKSYLQLRMGTRVESQREQRSRAQQWINRMRALSALRFLWSFVRNLPTALVYAVLQEVQVLPFVVRLSDPHLRGLRYPVSPALVNEFKCREHLFRQESEIRRKNHEIEELNKKITAFNERESKFGTGVRKPLKQALSLPQRYATHPRQTAKIFSLSNTFENLLLHDSYVQNFAMVGHLVEAVFESLPMLVLQYINNSQLDTWGSLFNRFSFGLSIAMVIMSCIEMIYQICNLEVFPLMRFKNTISDEARLADPLWLVGCDREVMFNVYDHETLQAAEEATEGFFRTVKGLYFDISSDNDFIANCLQGPAYVFQCLHNIICRLHAHNHLHLSMSDNQKLTGEHLECIFEALAQKELNELVIDLKYNTQLGEGCAQPIEHFIGNAKATALTLVLERIPVKFDKPLMFYEQMESLTLDLT